MDPDLDGDEDDGVSDTDPDDIKGLDVDAEL